MSPVSYTHLDVYKRQPADFTSEEESEAVLEGAEEARAVEEA